MIEGLRLLSWIHEAENRDSWGVPSSCEKCMETIDKQTRQTWKCAYEDAAPVSLRPYVKAPIPLGSDVEPTVCPGYSTRLHEVVEVHRGRLHWSKGSLDQFCRGYATEQFLIAIEICEGAINETQSWVMKNPQKKAGK